MSDAAHPSASSEQHAAEADIRSALAKQLGIVFVAPPVALVGLKLDAYAPGPPHVLVEIFARVGRSKPGQVRKLSRDMTKLLLAERRLAEPCRKIVAVIDSDAIAHFSNGWDGDFAREFQIELQVVQVDDHLRAKIACAQQRQYR